MSRFVALEYDAREVRVLVAHDRGGTLALDQAWTVPIDAAVGGESRPAGVGWLSAADTVAGRLSQARLGKAPALAAIGRASIELKQLTLPPAPDADLPDMVRFQATREFHGLTEDSKFDFMPLAGPETEPRSVLAAALPAETVAQVRDFCTAAKLDLKRLVLRPCAAASLLNRTQPATAEEPRLLVDLLAEEMDLTVLVGSQAVFLRTARLSPDGPTSAEGSRLLVGEIRRTITAAHNQLGSRRVEQIVLCGTGDEQVTLAERLRADLGLPVELFDPLAAFELGRELRSAPPRHAGRFAPLAGMLLDEFHGQAPAIDFLNPRQRPAPPRQTRKWAVAIAATALAVICGLGWVWWSLSSLDSEIASLQEQVKNVDRVLKSYAKLEKDAGEIEKWAGTDVAWLDELKELAAELPASDETMLESLQISATAKGGVIAMDGYAKSTEAFKAFGAKLRDPEHSVKGGLHAQDATKAPYTWKFSTEISVKPGSSKRYRDRFAATAKSAPASPAVNSGQVAGSASPAGSALVAGGPPAGSGPAAGGPAAAGNPLAETNTVAANSEPAAPNTPASSGTPATPVVLPQTVDSPAQAESGAQVPQAAPTSTPTKAPGA